MADQDQGFAPQTAPGETALVDEVSLVIDVTDPALAVGTGVVRIPRPREIDVVLLGASATAAPADPVVFRTDERTIPTVAEPRLRAAIERTVDLVLSVVALVVASPILLVLYVWIRLDSPGPAIFRQDRVRRGGGTFRFAKFRTMRFDARERFPELYAYDYSDEQVRTMKFKLPDDPRLTPVGRWLRRTSLDELPNLFNVIRGDMTLVGPRPEIPEMLPYYTPGQLAKFSVKPGLTGLAQTRGRNILTFQETIAADLEYVASRSLWLDIRILFRTVWTVAVQFGAL